MNLFIVILVTFFVVITIFILLLATSDPFYPFRRMGKDDIDDCYSNIVKPKKK